MNDHATTLQAFRFPRVEQNNATMSVNASVGFLEIQVSEALLVPCVHSLITAMTLRKQVSASKCQHGKNNCPKNRSQRKERKCGKCGETKHNARTCTNPPLRVQEAARAMRAASAKASASLVSQMTLTQMGAAQSDGDASSGTEKVAAGARSKLRCGTCGSVRHTTTGCLFAGTRGTEAERFAEAMTRSREHDASTKAEFLTSWLISSGMEPDRASALAMLIASKGSEDTSCFKEIYGEKVTFEAMRRLQPGMWIEDTVRTCVAALYLEAYTV